MSPKAKLGISNTPHPRKGECSKEGYKTRFPEDKKKYAIPWNFPRPALKQKVLLERNSMGRSGGWELYETTLNKVINAAG